MKKLLVYALMGTMFVGSQSMVFAKTEKTQTQAIKIESVKAEKIVKPQEEKAALDDSAKIKAISETLGMNYAEIKDKTLDTLVMELTDEQINKLIDAKVIEVIKATKLTEAMVGAEDMREGETKQGEGMLLTKLIPSTPAQQK